MQSFTLHTHTLGFDGQNTPAEMVACAKSLGMQAIGISNHFVVHPEIKAAPMYAAAVAHGYNAIYSATFEECIARFLPHYAELEKLAAAADIKIYRGMEVDFFDTPDWRAGFARACEILRPDYLIGSTHFVYYDGMLCNTHDMKNAAPAVCNQMLQIYWENVAAAGESGLFSWLAHLDLPKKAGLGLDASWARVEAAVLSRLAVAGAKIEINTGAYSYFDEPYPSRRILELVARHNIPVLISDDAHRADQIGRHFDRVEQFVRDCGVKNFLTPQKILDF